MTRELTRNELKRCLQSNLSLYLQETRVTLTPDSMHDDNSSEITIGLNLFSVNNLRCDTEPNMISHIFFWVAL